MSERQEKVGVFQVILLVLSVYVLIALAAEAVLSLSATTKHALQIADTGICVVFIADFFVCLYRAPNKTSFLKWGWIDFVSSIPALYVFRWGRLFRIIRILRSFRAVRILLTFLYAKRARGAFATVIFACGILVAFASITILHVETTSESNIRSVGDALWWSAVTITTVGYGDRFPVTAEGRILAILLMTAGVALYGVFTGFIASWFAENDTSKTDDCLLAMQEQIIAVRSELSLLRAEVHKAAASERNREEVL